MIIKKYFNLFKMELSLLKNKKWLRKNATYPLQITILGKPGKSVYDIGHYDKKDEDDKWIQKLYYDKERKGYIFVDDWGGETDPMNYDEAISFILDQFSIIQQIYVENINEDYEKKKKMEKEILDSNIDFALRILNNKSEMEEFFSKCVNCSKYLYALKINDEERKKLFCNKHCKKQYEKNK